MVRPPDQVGHHRQRQRGRQFRHAVDLAFAQGGVDDLRGLLVHAVADGAQCPRQHAMGDQLATDAVFRTVAAQRRSPGESIADRI